MMNIPFCERLENFNRVEAQKNWKGIVGNTIMHDIWKINIFIDRSVFCYTNKRYNYLYQMASVVYHSSPMMTQYSWSVLMKVWFTNALLNTVRNFFIPTRHMKPLFTILFGIPMSHLFSWHVLQSGIWRFGIMVQSK